MAFESRDAATNPSRWAIIARIAQSILALLILALTAYAVSVFGANALPGYGLTWFTASLTQCLWTFGFLAVVSFGANHAPVLQNHLAALGVEVSTAFWWLVAFAILTNESSNFGDRRGTYTGDGEYEYTNTYGSAGPAGLAANKAAAAFGGIEFGLLLVTIAAQLIASRSQLVDEPVNLEAGHNSSHPKMRPMTETY